MSSVSSAPFWTAKLRTYWNFIHMKNRNKGLRYCYGDLIKWELFEKLLPQMLYTGEEGKRNAVFRYLKNQRQDFDPYRWNIQHNSFIRFKSFNNKIQLIRNVVRSFRIRGQAECCIQIFKKSKTRLCIYFSFRSM